MQMLAVFLAFYLFSLRHGLQTVDTWGVYPYHQLLMQHLITYSGNQGYICNRDVLF